MKYFTFEDLYNVMNLGMTLRENQLIGHSEIGHSDKSGNDVLADYVEKNGVDFDVVIAKQSDIKQPKMSIVDTMEVVQGSPEKILNAIKLLRAAFDECNLKSFIRFAYTFQDDKQFEITFMPVVHEEWNKEGRHLDYNIPKEQALEEIKGKWILWRYKTVNTWAKNFVFNIEGDILELTDSSSYTKYPVRVLSTEIDYRLSTP